MATKVKPSRLQITGTPQAWDVPVYVDQDTFEWGEWGGWDVKVFEIQWPLDYATAEESRLEYLRWSPVIVMFWWNAYQYTTDTMLYSDIPTVFSTTTISVRMLNYTMSGGSVTGITSDIMTFTKPWVIDNLTSSSTTDALSANQGKILKTLVDNLTSRGRFLSLWNSATWLAVSTPQSLPYTYQTWDYFIVWAVSSATPSVNYRPDGSSYTWTASTTVESEEVEVWDTYAYDGTNWLLQNNHWKTVTFSEIAWDPYDNTNLASALNDKQDVSNMVTTLSWADNNHYPTTKAVADAISSAWGGDVLWPNSSTNWDVVLFDGTTWKLIKDSWVQLSSKANDSDVVHIAWAETIAGAKTFVGITRMQNGNPAGALILWADLNSATLTANTRKMARMTMPSYWNSAPIAIISWDSQTNTVDLVDFWWNPVASGVSSPDFIRFVVAKTHWDTTAGGKINMLEVSNYEWTDANNLRHVKWISLNATARLSNDAIPAAWDDSNKVPSTSWVQWEISGKQDELVSGVNIRTINWTSILWSWDITTPTGNTQTFVLASSSDTATAQLAYDWYADWNNPILSLDGKAYSLFSVSSSLMVFHWWVSNWNGTSYTTLTENIINVELSSGTVTAVSSWTSSTTTLSPTVNYWTPFTPTQNWHPATKKYVDDWLDAKQDTISDLATIRSGASAGATALQSWDDVSELNNDAGYLTSSTWVTSVNSHTWAVTVAEVPSWWTDGQVLTQTSGWTPVWANPSGWIENDTTWTTTTVGKIWAWSESEYNGLSSYNSNTIYYVF